MFEFNTWVVNNLIAGVKNSSFTKEWAAVQLANYYIKGKITEADIERFEAETIIAEVDIPAETEEGENI